MKRTALAATLALLLAGVAHAGETEIILYKNPGFQGGSQVVNGEVANLEGGFARGAESMVVKGGFWEACTGDHFKGRCFVLEPGEYPRLDDSLSKRIVSLRFLGATERVARGDRRDWDERRYRREARNDRNDRNDRDGRHDGRRDRSDGVVHLYNRPGFRGKAILVDNNEPNLRRERFDGRASSLIVRDGVWELCSEPRFEGMCRVYRPGRYEHLAELNDRVSSLRQLR